MQKVVERKVDTKTHLRMHRQEEIPIDPARVLVYIGDNNILTTERL